MDIEKEIVESLKKLHEKFDDFTGWRATVDERCKARCKDIDGHQRTLYGPDGRNGLVKQANSNTEFITSVRAWAIKVIGGAAIAALIAIAATLLNLWKVG